MDKLRKQLNYAYPMGHFAYIGDWDRYWEMHSKMRKECWPWTFRLAFRLGAINAWHRGDKWKP